MGLATPATQSGNAVQQWLDQQTIAGSNNKRKNSRVPPLSARIMTGRVSTGRVPTGRPPTGASTSLKVEDVLNKITESVPIRKLAIAFKHADLEGTGTVSFEELTEALAKIGADVSMKDNHILYRAYLDEGQTGMKYHECLKAARSAAKASRPKAWGLNKEKKGPAAPAYVPRSLVKGSKSARDAPFSPVRPRTGNKNESPTTHQRPLVDPDRMSTPSYDPGKHKGFLSGPMQARIKTASRPAMPSTHMQW